MTAFAYSVPAAGWLLWLAPFLLFQRKTGTVQKIDPRAVLVGSSSRSLDLVSSIDVP